MIIHVPVLAVVPQGRMAEQVQPVLRLDSGVELRPWRESDADALVAAGQDQRESDADALVAAGQDPAIRLWNRLTVPARGDALMRIARMGRRWQAERAAIWAIARPGEEAVGLIGWGDVDLEDGSAEIVYWLLPAARGAGIAVEATLRLTRWALDDLGLHRLRLCHSTANPASCRVAEKAGYTFEGTMRRALLHADGWHDQHLHALVRGDM